MRTDVIVIGAGQAGLAVSNLLTAAGVDHVVLERGQTGEPLDLPALGLAQATQPQLDDPAAGLELSGR